MKRIGTHFLLLATGICFLAVLSCKESKTPEQADDTAESEKTSQSMAMATGDEGSLPLERLNLPEGFSISTYAEGVDDARSMAVGDKGTLFVGTRKANKLYAIQDLDGDFKADRTLILDTTLIVPNGIAFRNGDLYVAEINRLLRYPNIEENLEALPEPEVIYEDYPTEGHHGWKYIAFGPDDKLYVPVGAPCNICDSARVDKRYASITRMDPDGSNREVYANGVRNTVGFTWHPETGELWFTDNGRDMMGDDVPPCELNRVSEGGQHFGYPFCHGGTIPDPEYGDQRPCSDFVPPVQNLGAHVAPLGVKFYTGQMFPDQYKGQAFIAEHGSWNRSSKVGYRITLVELEGNKAVSYKPFIDGWLDDASQEAFGRPVDLLWLDDGSMLISDDYGDAIYRVTYSQP